MGRHLDARAVIRDDGRMFSQNRLPQESGLLPPPCWWMNRGSMASSDRISISARRLGCTRFFAAHSVLPVVVYGHSTGYDDVELLYLCGIRHAFE